MDISSGISLIEPVRKVWRFLHGQYKKNPAHYLQGRLTSGLDIAYRIIGLFEAHDIKRTQIYRILGDSFTEITPNIDAEKLQSILNDSLITNIAGLFGVRRDWLEGEDKPIYELQQYNSNSFPDLVKFICKMSDRHLDEYCFLTALKSSDTSDDLYRDCPDVALFFSEPIVELNDKIIYRYYPIFGPFPWDHTPSRYHLCAFFRAADITTRILMKGYSVPQKDVDKISEGKTIPNYKMKVSGIWHPVDYAYPKGQSNGRVESKDWQDVLKYFKEAEELERGSGTLLRN